MMSLASELTKESLAQIIKSCPKNKAPGNDGLPKEFYVIFWNKIAELFIGCIERKHRKGGDVYIPKTINY